MARDEEVVVTYHCDFCNGPIEHYFEDWNLLLGKYDICEDCRGTVKEWLDKIEKERET